jgi:Glycosyl hydrolases family 43
VAAVVALTAISAGGRDVLQPVPLGATTAQPPATSTPEAPGIVVAESNAYDIPDPFMLDAGQKYYMYFSSAFGDRTASNVPYVVGTPGNWGPIHDAMPKLPAWAFSTAQQATTWDPFVAHVGDRYVMYAAPSLRVDKQNIPMHCIVVASSASPAGPFTAVGRSPLVCQQTLGGDIDAQLFYDPSGPRGALHPYYLVWKSDNNNLPGSGPCTIWAAPMSNDGLSLAGQAVAIFRPTRSWEEPVLEAPQMIVAPNGSLWLFFSSGAGYFTPRYDMGVVECSGILSGCFDHQAHLFITTDEQGIGPGEETIFVAADHSIWLLYNPWHSRIAIAPLRPAEAVRIGWGATAPYVAQAGVFPPPA